MRGRERAFMLDGGLFGVRGSFFLRRESMPGKPGLLVLARDKRAESQSGLSREKGDGKEGTYAGLRIIYERGGVRRKMTLDQDDVH